MMGRWMLSPKWRWAAIWALALATLLIGGCQVGLAEMPAVARLPTLMPTVSLNSSAETLDVVPLTEDPSAVPLAEDPSAVPPTWTLPPPTALPTATPPTPRPDQLPSSTPLPIPTNTPVTPSPTPSDTPTPSPTGTPTPDIRPLADYAHDEVIPIEAFPRPPGDNGWGIHWIPTNSQDPGVVDRFVDQAVRMHIKWVVFLNDNSNIGDNDYLVERLVSAGIMPVMRIWRSNVLPYDGDLGPMIAHYRAKGVYYFQLYNEPNVNGENSQGFPNPNVYAVAWAAAARDVIDNGGYPGLGALSPGGAYNHFAFLEGTLRALRYNGDLGLLNHSWFSVHNYHGTRQLDDPGGFLLFRQYDEIIRAYLERSMPMIGTEGGSYHPNPQVEKDLIIPQYTYMRVAEPYFFAFSHWILANKEGGSWDDSWEWQALFRDSFVHPVVTDFFYRNQR
ncbi:MAG: hypothetical protein JSW55_04055 [Chloroflexota bacterium]|nr:MAG: hypothetical protein JSW55_04055 [Chloroflexota bacterium]